VFACCSRWSCCRYGAAVQTYPWIRLTVSGFEDMLISLTTRCRKSRELGPRPNSKASTVSCAVEVPYQVEHHWVEDWLSPLHNIGGWMDRTARANQPINYCYFTGCGFATRNELQFREGDFVSVYGKEPFVQGATQSLQYWGRTASGCNPVASIHEFVSRAVSGSSDLHIRPRSTPNSICPTKY